MRVTLLTLCAALLAAAPTSAAVSYEHGLYKTGTKKLGASLTITAGRFDVNRIAFRDHCEGASGGFDEPVAFVKYDNPASTHHALLRGAIKADGSFTGKYSGEGSVFKVTGHVSGNTAKLTAAEHGSFVQNGETFHCKGSHSFTTHH